MIYPIIAYGDPILREKAAAIPKEKALEELAQAMFATMELAQGVGLAAPQIGHSMRLFVTDCTSYNQAGKHGKMGKQVFINPVLQVDSTTTPDIREEGCLSIPHVLVAVPRRERIKISYFDLQWQFHEEEWTGFPARVIQHEYDHLEGKLHIDYASFLKKGLLKKKLATIRQGKVNVPYQMRFYT